MLNELFLAVTSPSDQCLLDSYLSIYEYMDLSVCLSVCPTIYQYM